MKTDTLAALAALRGIADAYRDFRGEVRPIADATRRAILRAMGVEVESEAQL